MAASPAAGATTSAASRLHSAGSGREPSCASAPLNAPASELTLRPDSSQYKSQQQQQAVQDPGMQVTSRHFATPPAANAAPPQERLQQLLQLGSPEPVLASPLAAAKASPHQQAEEQGQLPGSQMDEGLAPMEVEAQQASASQPEAAQNLLDSHSGWQNMALDKQSPRVAASSPPKQPCSPRRLPTESASSPDSKQGQKTSSLLEPLSNRCAPDR